MTINELAKEMNVTESDAISFVECLRVWISKGYTIEQSIEKHMNQMKRFANCAMELSESKHIALEAFYA